MNYDVGDWVWILAQERVMGKVVSIRYNKVFVQMEDKTIIEGAPTDFRLVTGLDKVYAQFK